MNNLDIIMAGVRTCTGACKYCASANQSDVYRGNVLGNTLRKTLEEVSFDFDKLEKGITEYFANQHQCKLTLWGADPLSSILALSDLVDFLEYWAGKHNKKIQMTTSTNGVPIKETAIVNYCNQHKISIQLSHDGVAEWIRLPFDPLVEYQDNFKKIHKLYINCVAHRYNTDFNANIEYFNKWASFAKDIRFSKPMAGKNYSNAINPLTGQPFGDFSIIEDIDKYIYDYLHLPKPYHCNLNLGIDYFNRTEPIGCAAYVEGIRPSFHIDTLGNWTKCNLVDSLGKLGNPHNKLQFKECEDCEYKFSPICNGCILNEVESSYHDKCIFNKKLNDAIKLIIHDEKVQSK